ncbi:iron complex transport system substrate-binding protein [Microbacterium endophyticum]|uniref:Iron complex transport system substrate-binding protein n=1 Tax=Microbacterium endophyticum TaxID=1526412 RepID=A0A7W4V4E8_9MICO|nr:ABC transporter substrate-binding protein [Microbacterium endophyticum]MBB2976666.1 iron complex transport system substrate-binding protein [Microbacterium endophyticum]NIK37627.1 iron complex transport system substrate-binding protein [Microbacterium endophyticum]
MTSSTLRHRAARIFVPVLAVAMTALAGCSASTASTSSDTSTDAEWSYTDDTGTTVTLDHKPEKIASYADYAIGMMSYGLEPVAIFGRQDVASDDRFADYDLSNVAIVGNSYGEIDLEALAAAAPDIIVTGIYPKDRDGTLDLEGPYYAFADVEQQAQLEKIAPIVAIEIGGNGSDVIDSFNSLASALGVSDDTISEAKTEYDAAAADLTAAAAENDVEITQAYADTDGMYVVKPEDEPETALYGSLGVNFTNLNPDGDYYWDIYSWENVGDMMTGDVLLMNVEGLQEDDLLEQATFADDPALSAGQVYPWQVAAFDYASQAEQMTKLADIIRSADKVA